ncbi:hypothetical protein ACHAXR_013479 [Thalassiosira sp. AJA248-18]
MANTQHSRSYTTYIPRRSNVSNSGKTNSGGLSNSGSTTRSHNNYNRDSVRTSTPLHLMSKTGFTHNHKMSTPRRILRFIRLPHFSEYFMSVDHHQIWRRHLAWSLRDGDHLRNAVTSRFASNMVFMSLLLGTEIGVLFSPSKPADTFRAALQTENYGDANFWAAIMLCISIGLTLSTLVANFTAWAIIGAVSPHNSHAILRSSVGLDAAQLPARLVILSIYCFVVWVMLFIYILLPYVWGFVIALFPVALIAYIVILYSSFGRLVIYSRAMQQKEIFKGEEDNHMSSRRLFEELLTKAEREKKKQSPLPLYYRSKRELSQKISDLRRSHQKGGHEVDMGFDSCHATTYVSKILDASGHYDQSQINDLLKTPCDEEEGQQTPKAPEWGGRGGEEKHEENGFNNNGGSGGIPQSPSELEEQAERRDSFNHGPLESSRSLRSGRAGIRRGNLDDSQSSQESRRSRMSKGKGESSQSLFASSPGGMTTATFTL